MTARVELLIYQRVYDDIWVSICVHSHGGSPIAGIEHPKYWHGWWGWGNRLFECAEKAQCREDMSGWLVVWSDGNCLDQTWRFSRMWDEVVGKQGIPKIHGFLVWNFPIKIGIFGWICHFQTHPHTLRWGCLPPESSAMAGWKILALTMEVL